MLAVRLASVGVASRLIERSPTTGLGVAYSTTCDLHLLNVRSGRMSAFAGDPGHFVRWLQVNHPDLADPEGFAPRRVYGEYVRDNLARAEADHPGLIERIQGEAVAVEEDGVTLADGGRVTAAAVVLATGNPPPKTAGDASDGVIPDAWAAGALEAVRPSDSIVLIGAGLTMIDVVLMLHERGWLGEATAISRRGLTPRPHDARQAHPEPALPEPGALSRRLNRGRRAADAEGWAITMDRLRPNNAVLWQGLDEDQRGRFLRHLRPWWDVHRHRVAPQPWSTVAGLLDAGRLSIRAGRIETIAASNGGLAVTWRPRGQATAETLPADKVIDCTGPGFDPRKAPDALTRQLLASGRARPAPLQLGLDVDNQGRLVGRDGVASDRVFVLGPPARAAFWETVAVPDIRERIADLATRLAGLS